MTPGSHARADEPPEAARPQRRRAVEPLADRHPGRSSCSAGRCSWSARPAARAPTCARAATPTWPRWCRPSPTSTTRSSSGSRTSTPRWPTLTSAVKGADVKRFQRKVDGLKDPAGLTPRSGPGITVTLSDAPESVINSTTQDLNLLIVHQQDIQAVVNAMWKGGATAVTVQGQRIVTTTGIKCEGNSVQLQGVPYPQPYVISAVGDQGDLLASIADRRLPRGLPRRRPSEPDISVGWDLETEDLVTAPAYDGLLDINYAKPLR